MIKLYIRVALGFAALLVFSISSKAQAIEDLNMNGFSINKIKYVNIGSGEDHALRFNSDDRYSVRLGDVSNHHYGPVTSLALKSNVLNKPGRGWTWGSYGFAPVAALTTDGTMQLKNNMYVMERLGVGTNSPQYELDVCGTIRAKEVRVKTGWCDYVFEADYDLRSLESVEEYIQKNKHLPDVPSEAEIDENGLMLAEMQAIHMLKIEELTLYMIDMNKKFKALKRENEALREQLKKAGK